MDQLILRAGDAELAGPGDDPWRDLAVAQCTRSGGSEPVPGNRKHRVKRKYFAKECENAWRDFGQQPGMYLRWGRARRGRWGDDRYELRTREQQTIASLYLGKLPSNLESFAGASLGERSFTETRAARSLSPRNAEIDGRIRWAPFYSRSKNPPRHSWMRREYPSCTPVDAVSTARLEHLSHSPISDGSGSWSAEREKRMPS